MRSVLRLVDEVTFHRSTRFRFEPHELAIYFDPRRVGTETGKYQLLHEVAHILLGHMYGVRGRERWRMERDAWDVARILARQFDIPIRPEHAETQLRELRGRLARGFSR